jgi:hypothetical protein
MRSASRAAEIRSSRGMVGMTPPASRRERAGSGRDLRSGGYMAAIEKHGQARPANRSVHAFRGTADDGGVHLDVLGLTEGGFAADW